MTLRVFIFQIFLLLLIAAHSYGQGSLLNKTIKIDILNGTTENLLDEISKKGGFTFSCSNYLINLNRYVNLNRNTQSVKAFLDDIFFEARVEIDYLERANKIILKPKKVFKKFITISGNIYDRETGLPVINSNVNVAGSYIGTITDNHGNYTLKLKVNEQGESLIINYTHVSYESNSKVIEANADMTIDIEMNTRTLPINEISVFGMPQIAFKNKKYHVQDYELFDDKILLTVYERRMSKSNLFLINKNQQFLETVNVPGTSLGTHKDCIDDLYLVTYYKPYRINIDAANKISLASTIQNATNRLSSPCAAIGPNGYYYFYRYGPARLSVEYVYHDTYKEEDVVFRKIEDTTQIARYKDDPELLKEIFSNSRSLMADIEIGRLDKTRKPNFSEDFVDTLYKPVYAPMFLINDMIHVFNHVDSRIEIYNLKSKLVKVIPVEYPLNSEWFPKLYFDKAENRIYTHLQKDGYIVIHEIDLLTGNLKNPFKITFKKIEKIQVHNGYIYFLYKPTDSKNSKYKCLYQQNLFS